MSRFRWMLIPTGLMACGQPLGLHISSSDVHAKEPTMTPPVATLRDHALTTHEQTRQDPYFWMRDREDPEVIAYLEAENQYTQAAFAHTGDLQERLFQEIIGRIKQDDSSVPYFTDGAWYYSRYIEGGEYPIYARRVGSMDAPEQILVDGNARAEGKDYFATRSPSTSADDRVIAWAEDHVGRRIYTIFFRDLETGEMLPETIEQVTGNIAWALDGKTLLYGRQDPETLRSYRIFRHVLGTDPDDDVLVFEEEDDTFSTYVWRTKDKKYMVIGSFQTVSAEYRFIDATEPAGEWTIFEPRARDHEYSIIHRGDRWYVRTNIDGATNFKLVSVPDSALGKDNWTDVIPHRAAVYLDNFDVFDEYLVLSERAEALPFIRVMKWDGTDDHRIEFDEPAYMAHVGKNPTMESTTLRFNYTSPTTPFSVFDYDIASRSRTLKKEQPVLGDFDKANYETERVWAKATDGTPIPITLVYRKDKGAKRGAPTVLFGYGSYGATVDPTFNAGRLSLLDRGFVWAIAHVRGGQVMGRPWYDDGKLLNKKNTFTDFIACGQHLKDEGWAGEDTLYALGGSAGGLLVGAVLNMAPELWDGAVAAVPFVDVVTTMLDDSIPLTTSEYDEWGNPNDRIYYDYMLSYSPYDNVESKAYPALMVTSGLHDSQVQYWEPTKWVAKLRASKTNDKRLLLHTNMEAGHSGKSGRFEQYREVALWYTFLIDEAGLSTDADAQ
jgi:oligopeptidase B